MSEARNETDLIWKELKTEHLLQNQWLDFRKSTYQLPDGTVFEPYYSYSRRDYTVIVPFDTDGRLICVRQFRHGIRALTTEFPAGGIERSDGKEYGAPEAAENTLDAAKRELLEETGYTSDRWTHLLTIPSHATISDNYAYVYMAKGCRRVSDQHLDATEFLHVLRFTPNEIDAMIEKGAFQQAVHVMAWLLAKSREG